MEGPVFLEVHNSVVQLLSAGQGHKRWVIHLLLLYTHHLRDTLHTVYHWIVHIPAFRIGHRPGRPEEVHRVSGGFLKVPNTYARLGLLFALFRGIRFGPKMLGRKALYRYGTRLFRRDSHLLCHHIDAFLGALICRWTHHSGFV